MNKQVNHLVLKVIISTLIFVWYFSMSYDTIVADWGYIEFGTRVVIIIGLIATLFLCGIHLFVIGSKFADVMYDLMAKVMISGQMLKEDQSDIED